MPSLLQDLGLVETALGDLAAFAAGQPITSPAVTVGADKYDVSVVHLPGGADVSYQTIGGGFFAILGFAIEDAAAIAAGQPVKIAVKEGNTWYGVTLTKTV